VAQLALPRETMRWEWKRSRRSLVQIAVRVIHSGRRTIVRFSDSHRLARQIERALAVLQT